MRVSENYFCNEKMNFKIEKEKMISSKQNNQKYDDV